MKFTATLLLVAVSSCVLATATGDLLKIKRNSDKLTTAQHDAAEPEASASVSSEVVATASATDDTSLTDDTSAFSDEAQRIKRASYVTQNGNQYRIQIVKKPRIGKVNTIHIYPVNKKTHKKKATEEHQPQHSNRKPSPSATEEKGEDDQIEAQRLVDRHEEPPTASESPVEADASSPKHSTVFASEQERRNMENRARRKLEKMLDINSARYEAAGSEVYGTESGQQYDEHKKEKKIKVKHHHHHHHHNHVKTIIKKEPYPVEKIVEKIVHVPKPYPVEKIVHVPVEKVVEKIVHVPKPYPVEKVVEKIVHVPKPYPVEKLVEKIVHVPVEKIVHVPQPYPVKEIVEKRVPYPVEKIVHVPKPYPVEKIVEKIVHVPKPYPVYKHIHVPVEVKVPVPYPKPVPYPVEKKVPYPVEVKVEVEKKVPYPVKIYVPVEKNKHKHHHSEDGDHMDDEHDHSHHFTDSTYHDQGSPSIQRQSVSVAPQLQSFYQPRTIVNAYQKQQQQQQQNSYEQNLLNKLNPKFATIQRNQQQAIQTLEKQLLTHEQYRVQPLQGPTKPLAKVKPLAVDPQQMAQWQKQQDQNRQYQHQLQQFQHQQLQRQQTQILQQQNKLQQQQQTIDQQHQQQQQQQAQQQRQSQIEQSQPASQHHYQKGYQQPQPAASSNQPLLISVRDNYSYQTQSWPHQQVHADAAHASSNVQPTIIEAAPVNIQQHQSAYSHQYQSFEPDLSGSSSNLDQAAVLAPPPNYFHAHPSESDEMIVAASTNAAVAIVAAPSALNADYDSGSFQIAVSEQAAEGLPQPQALSGDVVSINNFQYSDSADFTAATSSAQFTQQDAVQPPHGFGFVMQK